MNLSQLRENLLKPAVDRLESCLGPGDGGPAGRAANRHPGPVRDPAILGGRNQCEAGIESGQALSSIFISFLRGNAH